MRPLRHFALNFVIAICFITQTILYKSLETLPLYGNLSLGWYYVELFIGNPPQKLSLFPDTGSSMLVMPCAKCIACDKDHRFPNYNKEDSSTSKFVYCGDDGYRCNNICSKSNQLCEYQVIYGENSQFNGHIIKDQIRLTPNSQTFQGKFVCVDIQQNSYYTLTQNGLLGLSYYHSQSIIFGLFKKMSKKSHYKFSICLQQNGGYMEFGDINMEQSDALSTISVESNHHWEFRSVENITFGELSLKPEGEFDDEIVIDSGSTFSYFPKSIFERLISYIKDQLCQIQKKCDFKKIYQTNNNQNFYCYLIYQNQTQNLNEHFPRFQIKTKNGYILTWQPDSYFKKLSNYHPQYSQPYYCLGIKNTTKTQKFILGMSWLQNKKVIFDSYKGTMTIRYNQSCIKNQQLQTTQSHLPDKIIIIASLVTIIILMIAISKRKYIYRMLDQLKIKIFTKNDDPGQFVQENSKDNKEYPINQQMSSQICSSVLDNPLKIQKSQQ